VLIVGGNPLYFRGRRVAVRLTAGILAILSLFGCGLSPNNSEIERALSHGDPLIGKIYEIRNIRRINGYERPEGYVVEVSAELQILEKPTDYFARLSTADQTGAGALAAVGMATAGLGKWGLMTAATISASKKGDVIPFSGTITMIKSEQGWILRPD